ncbi:MAG TPA: lysophospholipid acyltransferase family protein [Candidatus Limnocylindria bacterium]|jgi:1-acyl-sn-glycerol-3-phosphate acyltransferase
MPSSLASAAHRVASWFFLPGAAACGLLARILFSARVEGVEHVPRTGPFVLVANHCSNLDPPIIGWAAGKKVGRIIHFMAKDEMRSWPLAGWLAQQSAVIFVRRGEADRAAQKAALDTLADGRPIALFIEGTRSRDGHLKVGRGGAAFLAMRSGAPLLPVAISGTHRIFPGSSRWPHPTKVVVRIGEPFSLGHVADGRLDREALAAGTERIMATIEGMLPPEQRRVP